MAQCILPVVTEQFEEDGEPDYIARSESFSNYADMLRKTAISATGNITTGRIQWSVENNAV